MSQQRAQFHPLNVTEVRRETRDAVVLTLAPPMERADDFAFREGQYLTFRRDFDGEELRRSYSICAGVDDGVLRVGVKRVDGGWFSNWVNDEVKVGDTLEAMAPDGRFYGAIEPEEAKTYLGFAGGSGITPIISIIKTVLAAEPKSAFTLVYGNRSVNAVMFREELEDLKNTYMGRLSILHILENDAGEVGLFNGRVDREKCAELFERWIDAPRADMAFVCGPEPMMLAVSDALKIAGLDEKKIKIELFKSAPRKNGAAPSVNGSSSEATDASEGKGVEATIIIDGAARTIRMPAEGVPVLQAALDADLPAPFSCRAGVCSTCRARVVEGETEMTANYSLEDYEVERGYVLTCQCYPLSDKIVVDYDQH